MEAIAFGDEQSGAIGKLRREWDVSGPLRIAACRQRRIGNGGYAGLARNLILPFVSAGMDDRFRRKPELHGLSRDDQGLPRRGEKMKAKGDARVISPSDHGKPDVPRPVAQEQLHLATGLAASGANAEGRRPAPLDPPASRACHQGLGSKSLVIDKLKRQRRRLDDGSTTQAHRPGKRMEVQLDLDLAIWRGGDITRSRPSPRRPRYRRNACQAEHHLAP